MRGTFQQRSDHSHDANERVRVLPNLVHQLQLSADTRKQKFGGGGGRIVVVKPRREILEHVTRTGVRKRSDDGATDTDVSEEKGEGWRDSPFVAS